MGKIFWKCLSVCLVFSLVLVPCKVSYAATAAPSIDVEGGLSYLIQMLSSSLGVQVSKASVPALWVAVDAQAKANDPKYMEELRGYCEDNSLISTRELDPSFCNQLLKDLRSIFISSGDYGTDATEYAVPVTGDATYFDVAGQVTIRGVRAWTYNIPAGVYVLPVLRYGTNGQFNGVLIYFLSDVSFFCSRVGEPDTGFTGVFGDFQGLRSCYWVSLGLYSRLDCIDLPLCPQIYNPVVSDTVDTSIFIDKALAAIQAQALAHPPAITKPVSIPADDAALKSNLAGVQAADDADALYKALGAAGIAIDIGTDIPDETEKPTTGETTDDGTVSVGKSLSDILAAITGLADKVAAIPLAIENFFTLDTAVIESEFTALKSDFLDKFGGITSLAGVFKRSYDFGNEIPVITVPVPLELRDMFAGKTEVVMMDLRPHADIFHTIRTLVSAMFWIAFAKWFLDQFDVSFHVG